MNDKTEGWGYFGRKFHYFINGMSLCRRVGFFRGEITPDSGNGYQDTDDCRECRREFGKIKARPGIVTETETGKDTPCRPS
jgi:hypothetical protein